MALNGDQKQLLEWYKQGNNRAVPRHGLTEQTMANTNSKLYTNKDMARICNVSEASMTNLVKSLGLVPVKTGKYGRKYYNSKDLKKIKIHYKNKAKSVANSSRSTIKDNIIKQQQNHIEDLKAQIKTLNHQLEVKDNQIETQNQQLKQNTQLLSQAHILTLQAQKSKDDESEKVQKQPETVSKDTHGWIWKIFH